MSKDTRSKESAKELYQSMTGPVLLDHQRAHTKGRDAADIFNDCGFVVRGKTDDGEDFYLWTFQYQQKANEDVKNGDLCQTVFMVGKYSDEQKKYMHDMPYINKGQNLEDYYPNGALQVEETKDHVTWSVGGRLFLNKPPHWEIKGEHAGVRCDVKLTQRGPGFHHFGPFDKLGTEGTAGYMLHGTATGEVEANGKKYKISGHFVQERSLQVGHIPSRIQYMGGRGMNWMHGWSKEFSWYVLNGDFGPLSVGMFNIDGEMHCCEGPENVWAEEIGFWLDPRTNQVTPHKWRMHMRMSEGNLEATVTGYRRAFYTWVRRGGVILVNQFMADATARFTTKGGKVIESRQVAMNEHMRTLYLQD